MRGAIGCTTLYETLEKLWVQRGVPRGQCPHVPTSPCPSLSPHVPMRVPGRAAHPSVATKSPQAWLGSSPCPLSPHTFPVPTRVPVSLPGAGDPQVGGQPPDQIVLARLELQSVPALLVAHEGPVASTWVFVGACPGGGDTQVTRHPHPEPPRDTRSDVSPRGDPFPRGLWHPWWHHPVTSCGWPHPRDQPWVSPAPLGVPSPR